MQGASGTALTMVLGKGQEPNEKNLNLVTIHPSIHPQWWCFGGYWFTAVQSRQRWRLSSLPTECVIEYVHKLLSLLWTFSCILFCCTVSLNSRAAHDLAFHSSRRPTLPNCLSVARLFLFLFFRLEKHSTTWADMNKIHYWPWAVLSSKPWSVTSWEMHAAFGLQCSSEKRVCCCINVCTLCSDGVRLISADKFTGVIPEFATTFLCWRYYIRHLCSLQLQLCSLAATNTNQDFGFSCSFDPSYSLEDSISGVSCLVMIGAC